MPCSAHSVHPAALSGPKRVPANRKKQKQNQKTWLMTLNTVVLKSSSLNDWQQSTFAGYYWLQHTRELSSWAATESKDCTATLFTFLSIWLLCCCGCGLGFLVCLIFIRFFGDRQEKIHSGIYSSWRLFPSVSYPG